jgi:two-component system, chemotaxis family, response regulator Rcp1
VDRRTNILLVEDNPAAADLMRIALAEKWPECILQVSCDGEAALALLHAGPVPDLVLLDLNLPRLHGHEVLAALRASRATEVQRLPVVVLSTSSDPNDVLRSHELFASSHIVKPQGIEGLFEMVESIASYWFKTVALPSAADVR